MIGSPYSPAGHCFVLKTVMRAPDELVVIIDAIGRFGAVTTSLVLRSEPIRPLDRRLPTVPK